MNYIFILIIVEIILILYGKWDYRKNRDRSTFMYWHSQNLSDKKKPLPLWRDGRGWLRIGEMTIHPTWYILQKCTTGIGFSYAADDFDLQFHIGISPLFSFWLSFDRLPFLHPLLRPISANYGYDVEFRASDHALWFSIFYCDMWGTRSILNWMPKGISFWEGMTYKEYNWWHGFQFSIHYLDMLLGSKNYASENVGEPVELYVEIEPDTTLLGMSYKVVIQMNHRTWKRPRWPTIEHVISGEVECIPPIPEPGKGENSWDCEDDALFGGTFSGNNPEEIARAVVRSVMRQRKKYGLPDSIQLELGKEHPARIEETF